MLDAFNGGMTRAADKAGKVPYNHADAFDSDAEARAYHSGRIDAEQAILTDRDNTTNLP